MTDEQTDVDPITDTGPLRWERPSASRGHVAANLTIAACVIVITAMLIAYGSAGWT